MKTGTENKLKFKQLQRRLDLPLWQARGLLETIWKFVADNCPAGDIGRFTDEEIAIGIEWRDDPKTLVDLLINLRWLDRHDQHRLIVHDWPEHCEDNVHKILARRIDAFADGTIPKLSRFDKRERPKLLKDYGLKYGKEAVEIGCVSVRPCTPENAPALPCLALPCLAPPSHASLQNESPDSDANGGLAGGNSVLVSEEENAELWNQVANRLAAMGASQWKPAIDAAIANQCSPQTAFEVIEHGDRLGFGVGAILVRLKRTRPSTPINDCWPEKSKADKAAADAKAAKKKADLQRAKDARTGEIIRAGRKAKKSDEEINVELAAEGLELLELVK